MTPKTPETDREAAIVRDGWYSTTRGVDVRVVCTDVPGESQLIGVTERGSVMLLEASSLVSLLRAQRPSAEGAKESAPANSLPSWSQCQLIIENHKFRNRAAAGDEGAVLDTPETTPEPTELHRFIYEYDDADPYRSAWFMHRLEKLIAFVRAEAPTPPSPSVAALPAKWREEGQKPAFEDDRHAAKENAYEHCADELDAALRLAAPADDAGVRVEAAAEALAKMIIRQEALTMKTPEAAMHHMAHWRRAIEEGRDLLATLNRVAAEAAASAQEGG